MIISALFWLSFCVFMTIGVISVPWALFNDRKPSWWGIATFILFFWWLIGPSQPENAIRYFPEHWEMAYVEGFDAAIYNVDGIKVKVDGRWVEVDGEYAISFNGVEHTYN